MRPTLLDHIVIATPDLAGTVADIARATGVTARPGGVHPSFGTRNHLVGLGQGHYLEVIAADPDQDVEARVFGLDRTTTTRVATWAMRPEESAEVCRRANEQGVAVGELTDGRRRTEDGTLLIWRLTTPLAADPTGVVPFIIDWGTTTTPGASLPAELELVSLIAHSPQPEALRQRLDILGADIEVLAGEQTGLSLELAGPAGRWTLAVATLPE